MTKGAVKTTNAETVRFYGRTWRLKERDEKGLEFWVSGNLWMCSRGWWEREWYHGTRYGDKFGPFNFRWSCAAQARRNFPLRRRRVT